MPRKIVVVTADAKAVLEEVAAADELQLQERMKDDPEIVPVEDFGGLSACQTHFMTDSSRVDAWAVRNWYVLIAGGILANAIFIVLASGLADSTSARTGVILIGSVTMIFTSFLLFLGGVRYAERTARRGSPGLWSSTE